MIRLRTGLGWWWIRLLQWLWAGFRLESDSKMVDVVKNNCRNGRDFVMDVYVCDDEGLVFDEMLGSKLVVAVNVEDMIYVKLSNHRDEWYCVFV